MALGLVLPTTTIIAQEDSRPPRPPGDEDAGFERRPERRERSERFQRGDRPGQPARDGREGRGNPPGHFRQEMKTGERMGRPPGPVPPLIGLFDKNRDGELDQEEISNSAKALATLDRDGDGKISRDELRPRGEMRRHGSDDAERGRGNEKIKGRRQHDGPPPVRPDGPPLSGERRQE